MNTLAEKSKSLVCLQVTMWTVCAFHLATGIGVNLGGSFIDLAADGYGAEVAEWSPQFLFILKPLGVFMTALGILAAVAAMRPRLHRSTIYVFAGIFIARAAQRLLFADDLQNVFGIASGRNIGNMVFFVCLAAVLIVLDQLANRTTPTAAPAG